MTGLIFKERAYVHNESTSFAPWFVYIEDTHGCRTMAVRFSTLVNARRVQTAINRALEEEHRLLLPGERVDD